MASPSREPGRDRSGYQEVLLDLDNILSSISHTMEEADLTSGAFDAEWRCSIRA